MNSQELPPLEFKGLCSLAEGAFEAPAVIARLVLSTDSLGIAPDGSQPRSISLRQITSMMAEDYRVVLETPAGRVVISQLGRGYDDFQRELSIRRSALLLSDLLMEEPLVFGNLMGDFNQKITGERELSGRAEIRLYQTALVVIPVFGTPVRVPFSEISQVAESDYRLAVTTEYDGEFVFSRLGRDMGPLNRNLKELRQQLSLAAQVLVRELMPSASQEAALRLAELMKEGRAARRRDIESLGRQLWSELEQRLLDSEAAEEYTYLKAIGRQEDISIGVKRSLKEGESDYLWFLVPVASTEPRKPGNAVVMEAVSEDCESRATYVFRLVSRAAYPVLNTEERLAAEVENFLRGANRALVKINFRREPVYLPAEMLLRPQYARYAFSVAALPELRALRWLYVGRVIHSALEQWREDLNALLSFNTSTTDDNAVWRKGSG
jgi:hypothetical protein